MQRRPARWARILLVNSASGAIPALVALLFMHLRPVDLIKTFFTGEIYSYCIGTLAWLTIARVGGAIWCRPEWVKWPLFILLLLGIGVVGCLAGTAVVALTGLAPRNRFWQYYGSSLRLALLITLGCGILTSLYETMRAQLETKERDEQQARQMAVAARLSSLESRIHPHFLFNTLNSISALIREDPGVAERTVERLAALLRFSLDSEGDHLVPLRQEMKIVTDYLEIEKTRFGPRLRYTMDIPTELQDLEVPPMSLQTLAENSVKHAVSTRREGAEIRIIARRDGDRVVLEVQDNGPGFHEAAVTAGHGLDLLKGRLAALFANRAALEIASRSGETAVRLCLPEHA